MKEETKNIISKIFSIYIFFILCLGFVTIFISNNVNATTTTIFNDNFESGTSKWTIGGASLSTEHYNSSSHSLKISEGSIVMPYASFSNTNNYYNFTFEFYMPSTTNTGLIMFAFSSGGVNQMAFGFYNGNSSYVSFVSDAWSEPSEISFPVNDWIHINGTCTTTYWRLFVDGVELIFDSVNNDDIPTKLTIGSPGGDLNGPVYIDDFVISADVVAVTDNVITTPPVLTWITGTTMNYDFNSTATTVTWDISTNATWMSIGSSTGTLSGTPVVGSYWVVLYCNGTVENDQISWTLSVYNSASWFLTNTGCVSPTSTSWGGSFYDAGSDGTGNYGRLYVIFLGLGNGVSTLSPYITYFDAHNRTWADSVIIAQSPSQADSHGISKMFMDDEGYIHVYYGSHETPLLQVKSTHPRDISTWTQGTSLFSTGVTYPYIYYDDANDTVYLFGRSNVVGENKGWSYIKSINEGTTWSSETVFVNTATAVSGTYYNCYVTGWYFSWNSLNQLQIDCGYFMNTDGTFYKHGIGYFHYNLATGIISDVNGTAYGSYADASELLTSLKVATTSLTGTSWYTLVSMDSNNYPYLYSTYQNGTGQVVYQTLYHWTGTNWVRTIISDTNTWIASSMALWTTDYGAIILGDYADVTDTVGGGDLYMYKYYKSNNTIQLVGCLLSENYHSTNSVGWVGLAIQDVAYSNGHAKQVIIGEYGDYAYGTLTVLLYDLDHNRFIGDGADLSFLEPYGPVVPEVPLTVNDYNNYGFIFVICGIIMFIVGFVAWVFKH